MAARRSRFIARRKHSVARRNGTTCSKRSDAVFTDRRRVRQRGGGQGEWRPLPPPALIFRPLNSTASPKPASVLILAVPIAPPLANFFIASSRFLAILVETASLKWRLSTLAEQCKMPVHYARHNDSKRHHY